MINHSQMKLGCLPPHPEDKSKRVAFTSLFSGAILPAPSPARDWTGGETSRPVFSNDTVGDCTIAAIANIIVGVLKETYNTDWYPTTGDVLSLYYKLTGGDDTGLVVEDVLKYVMNNGAFGHHFIGTASIEPGDAVNIKRAIDWYGAVDIGIGLPLAWQSTSSWTLLNYSNVGNLWKPWSWGGHSISAERYDTDYIYVWSWGELIPLSWDALRLYADTVDMVFAASWIRDNRSPGHLDLATLKARMVEFKA